MRIRALQTTVLKYPRSDSPAAGAVLERDSELQENSKASLTSPTTISPALQLVATGAFSPLHVV